MLRATTRTVSHNNSDGGLGRAAALSVIAHCVVLVALTIELSFPSPVTHLDTVEVEIVLEAPDPESELRKEEDVKEGRTEQDKSLNKDSEEKSRITTRTTDKNEGVPQKPRPNADDLAKKTATPLEHNAESEKKHPKPPQSHPAFQQLAKLAKSVDEEKSSAQQVLALDTVPGCTARDMARSTSSHIDGMAESAETGRSYAQAAVNAQVSGYFRKAIDLYDTAILAGDLSRNNLAKVYNNRGAAYRVLGFSGLAIDDYNEAMRLKPNYATAYFNRGVAYRLNNENDLAIRDFTRSIQLDSGYADPYVQRGVIYAEQGAHKRATSDFSRAIKLAPCLASAYFNRGRVFESTGDLERAIADFKKSYVLSPSSKEYKAKLLSLPSP